MNETYNIQFAKEEDIDSWMRMVHIVKENFPGLETSQQIESYQKTVIKNMNRKTAICAKNSDEVIGVLLFSYNSKCLSCMAVHPEHRRKGIASAMITKMIDLFPKDVDITVTTFRKEDIKGIAPRTLYKKFGFIEDELVEEFDYPNQKFVLYRKG